jgi:hypothetical protein|tara:strand:+ start:903 stop:1607 length:705 start_codon:yes stop_codon:yes gene_type:complete
MFNVQREHLEKIITNIHNIDDTEVNILFGINIQNYKVNFVCQHEDVCMTLYKSDILSSIEYFNSLYEFSSSMYALISKGLTNVVNFVLFDNYLKINNGNMELSIKKYVDNNTFYDQLTFYEIPEWNYNENFEISPLILSNTLDIAKNINDEVKISLMTNKLIIYSKNDTIKFKHSIDIVYNKLDIKRTFYFNATKLHYFVNLCLQKDIILKLSFYNNIFRGIYDKYEILMAPLM